MQDALENFKPFRAVYGNIDDKATQDDDTTMDASHGRDDAPPLTGDFVAVTAVSVGGAGFGPDEIAVVLAGGGAGADVTTAGGAVTVAGAAPTCGCVAEAFIAAYYMEKACQFQILAQSSGQPLVIPEAEPRQRSTGPARRSGRTDDAWPALLEMLDAEDPSYRS